MKQVPNYNLWVFTGHESLQPEFRGRSVDLTGWYVGHEPGKDIQSGPFKTEASALFDADAMTNTFGT